ncbi:hypothetical protein E2562_004904 [Oryza meyeriana var. granulata]|uniref:Uncharacterized protein n=1 Tax=Oryza meyeriana var. granulata TaxID=110450 RepID=A0A6G1C5S5_9ORYZ|nr:hypothetical protein E2562_004904 [Oryza meyeriana var. granulata]
MSPRRPTSTGTNGFGERRRVSGNGGHRENEHEKAIPKINGRERPAARIDGSGLRGQRWRVASSGTQAKAEEG